MIDTRRRHTAHRRAGSAPAGAMSATVISPITPAGQRHSSAVPSPIARHHGSRTSRHAGVLTVVTRSTCLIEGASPTRISVHTCGQTSHARSSPKWSADSKPARTRESVERARPATAA